MTEPDIRDLLIEIKTKVDILVTQQGDHETRLRVVEARPTVNAATQGDHEVRIRALEAKVPEDHQKQHADLTKFRWVIVGAATVAGGIAGELVRLL